MVVAFQGYDNKQNKAPFITASIAGMIAMQSRQKTIVLQFLSSRDRGVEVSLNDVFHNQNDMMLSNNGIDSLLDFSDGREITPGDFTSLCDPILKAENRLDVASITKSNSFILQLAEKKKEIKNLLDNTTEVYDNILLLLPVLTEENKDIIEYLNSFAQISIYCRRQGNRVVQPVFGNRIIYMFADFESESKYGMRDAKKNILMKKNESLLKIEHNRSALDADMEGRLIYFIKQNRDASGYDVNTKWVQDIKNAIDVIFDGAVPDEEPNWDNLKFVAGKEYNALAKANMNQVKELSEIVEVPNKLIVSERQDKKGFFRRLFGGSKKKNLTLSLDDDLYEVIKAPAAKGIAIEKKAEVEKVKPVRVKKVETPEVVLEDLSLFDDKIKKDEKLEDVLPEVVSDEILDASEIEAMIVDNEETLNEDRMDSDSGALNILEDSDAAESDMDNFIYVEEDPEYAKKVEELEDKKNEVLLRAREAAEAARLAEEAMKQAEEEARRIEAERERRRLEEIQRQKAEQERLKAEAEQKRREEEARKKAEKKAREEYERLMKEAEEAQAAADREAKEARRKAEEAAQAAEAVKKAAEEKMEAAKAAAAKYQQVAKTRV